MRRQVLRPPVLGLQDQGCPRKVRPGAWGRLNGLVWGRRQTAAPASSRRRSSGGSSSDLPPSTPHFLTPLPPPPPTKPNPSTQANIWELEFAASPEALQQLNRELRINEAVLRYVMLRRDGMPKLPLARAMYHKDPKFGHLLRSPALPGALPIPLAEAAAGAAAATAAAAAAAARRGA